MTGLLVGEKNGEKTGKRLNIVVKGAGVQPNQINQSNENIYN